MERSKIVQASWDKALETDPRRLVRDALIRVGKPELFDEVYEHIQASATHTGIDVDSMAWALQTSAMRVQNEALEKLYVRFVYSLARIQSQRADEWEWLEDILIR